MYHKQVTVHFNDQDKPSCQGRVTFGEGPYHGGGHRLLSLSYEVNPGKPSSRVRDRKYSWNGMGDNFSDINGMLIDNQFFGRSEFDHIRLQVENKESLECLNQRCPESDIINRSRWGDSGQVCRNCGHEPGMRKWQETIVAKL